MRRSVRRRLLFANVAGGLAVITFVLLASGEELAPDLPLALTLGAPFVPAALLVLLAYLWGHRAFSRAIAWAWESSPFCMTMAAFTFQCARVSSRSDSS